MQKGLFIVVPEFNRTALYYDDSAYRETLTKIEGHNSGRPAGLMGRQVAGKEFLDAYLSHGTWEELMALVPNSASGQSLAEFCRLHPSSVSRRRRLSIIPRSRFRETFLTQPPAAGIYFPCPPDPAFAWARQSGPSHGFALSGVTHTLCTARAVEVLRNMITAPYEEYDRLICTSQAVARMVRNVWEAYADHLKERLGGTPKPRIQLVTIPLGVNTEKYRPPSPEEQLRERSRLGITDEEMAVLFVGRLSHHAKAHPFPMYRGLAEASAKSGQKVHLLMVGWASSPPVMKAFQDGANAFAPHVRVTFLDGLSAENRFGAWRAADIFVSLSDNIQETFGLVIVEAMASGLPVVASDWNGYRDLVTHEETGFLVPTYSVRDSMQDLTSKLLFDELNYDHFLARSSQAVAIDASAVAKSFLALFENPERRLQMGTAGRKRAVELFSWDRIIRAYESLWQEQEQQRKSYREQDRHSQVRHGPAAYPAPEWTFAGYPTKWLADDELLQSAPDAHTRLEIALTLPLTNHVAESRCSSPACLIEVLDRANTPCPLAELAALLQRSHVSAQTAKATLGWMLKYDLLRLVSINSQQPPCL